MSFKHTNEKREIDVEMVATICDGGCGRSQSRPIREFGYDELIGWYQVQKYEPLQHHYFRDDAIVIGLAEDKARHFCPDCAAKRFA